MTINTGDIKLLASQVMDDIANGGGAPTSTIIQDGVSNAIFNDISEVDRAGGNVSLRKLFVSVQTPTTDTYLGANLIVSELPEDPNVSVTVFPAADPFDQRAAAAGRVAAYLNAGAEWPGYLYENHIAGQRVIQLFARPGVAAPPVGRTLVLRQNEGLPNQVEQYVRVIRTATEERTFTTLISGGLLDYQAQVITCDISDALRVDFAGSPDSRLFTSGGGKTKIRDTVVADAAAYYGAARLVSQASLGDISVAAASVYSQIVPNAQTETTLTDIMPAATYSVDLAASPRPVSVSGSPFSQRIRVGQENRGYNYTTILTPLPAPGSTTVRYRALGNSYTLTDDGQGNLSGSRSGRVNYLTGSVTITLQALPDDRSAIVLYWGQRVAYTNRAGAIAVPAPSLSLQLADAGIETGSLVVTWQVGGVTKSASSDTYGNITGDATGRFYRSTSLVVLTDLTALPSDFAVDYNIAGDLVVSARPGLEPDDTGTVLVELDEEPQPGSVTVEWLTTVSRSAATGSGSGALAKARASLDSLDAGFEMQMAIVTNPSTEKMLWAQYVSTSATLKKSILSLQEELQNNGTTTIRHRVNDDALGGFFGGMGTVAYTGKALSMKVTGDYNYAGWKANHENANDFEALNATPRAGESQSNASAESGGGGASSYLGGDYAPDLVTEDFGTSSLFVSYLPASATPVPAATKNIERSEVLLDLLPTTSEAAIPGSIQFTWMGTTYTDNNGVIYRGATPAGEIDYRSGVVKMIDFLPGANPNSITVQSLWTTKPTPSVASVVFEVPSAPIKPAGFVFSCNDLAGDLLVATAGIDGMITGSHTRGVIDYQTGLGEIMFGDYLTDALLSDDEKAAWWYDPENVQADGKIWRPWPVDPSTPRYNAVCYSYLPLDANLLGLDPVRLPSDGKVPIFRPGYFGVIGHTDTIGPLTVSNGQTVDCGRVRLSRIRVLDADGLAVTTGYTVDLDAGTLTFTDVAGLNQPLTIKHHIEDMAMISDVQINGNVSFTRQLTHDFPAGSVLSSAVMMGDLRARITNLFDQQTWGNVWDGAVIGAAAPASFNDAAHPISVTNAGTLTERWAVVFTSSSAFQVIGEHVGIIAVGNTATDCAPINPASNQPYFTIPATGWGIGWAAGNAMRFDTAGPFFPFWCVLTVQQGQETAQNHNFTLLTRGDIDRP